MGICKLIDVDPLTGLETWHEYDHNEKKTIISYKQDVQRGLDHSKALQNDPEAWKTGVKKDMALYAHIPDIVLLQWKKEGVDITDTQALFKMVNKPEYAYLRTTTKRHLAR